MEIGIWAEWINYFRDNLEKGLDYFALHNLLVRQLGTSKVFQTCSQTFSDVLEESAPDVNIVVVNKMEEVLVKKRV